jgi:Zinc-binding dehydrogenase
MSAALIYPIPGGVSFEDAAAHCIVFTTAYHCLKFLGRVQSGESVLVHAAAGGVGTATVQLAKLFGARVLACASRDDKLSRVKALGADATINYVTTDFVEVVRRATEGRGVDVVPTRCRRSRPGRSFSGAACGIASRWTSSCLRRPAQICRIRRDRGARSHGCGGPPTITGERPARSCMLAAAVQRERSTDRCASRVEPVWGRDLTLSTCHRG